MNLICGCTKRSRDNRSFVALLSVCCGHAKVASSSALVSAVVSVRSANLDTLTLAYTSLKHHPRRILYESVAHFRNQQGLLVFELSSDTLLSTHHG
jgi:hypothetical protein